METQDSENKAKCQGKRHREFSSKKLELQLFVNLKGIFFFSLAKGKRGKRRKRGTRRQNVGISAATVRIEKNLYLIFS